MSTAVASGIVMHCNRLHARQSDAGRNETAAGPMIGRVCDGAHRGAIPCIAAGALGSMVCDVPGSADARKWASGQVLPRPVRCGRGVDAARGDGIAYRADGVVAGGKKGRVLRCRSRTPRCMRLALQASA